MKLTIQRLLSKYAFRLVAIGAGVFAFSMLQDEDKRALGQFLSIASYFVIAVLSYALLSCPSKRARRALWAGFRKNDFRMLRVLLQNRDTKIRLLCLIGSLCCLCGSVAQMFSNQVAAKPIPIHFGNPIICIVLFWILVHPQNRSRYGSSN